MTEPEVALPTMGPDQLNNCRGRPHLMSNAVFAESGDMQTAPATEEKTTDYAMTTAALSPLSHAVFAASLNM